MCPAFAGFCNSKQELLPLSYSWSEVRHTSIYRILGVFVCTISVFGLIFLGHGLAGDKYLRYAAEMISLNCKADYIKKAKAKAMTKDEAEEQYARPSDGSSKGDQGSTGLGKRHQSVVQVLYHKTQAKQLMELLNLARQIRNQELLKALVPYLPPAGIKNVSGSLSESK